MCLFESGNRAEKHMKAPAAGHVLKHEELCDLEGKATLSDTWNARVRGRISQPGPDSFKYMMRQRSALLPDSRNAFPPFHD